MLLRFCLFEPRDDTRQVYCMLLERALNSNKNSVTKTRKEAHEWLADKVCTRSGHAAVCKINANKNQLLGLALHVRRAMLLKSVLQ